MLKSAVAMLSRGGDANAGRCLAHNGAHRV